MYLATGSIDDESSVEMGFEPGTLRLCPRGRDLTTRPQRAVARGQKRWRGADELFVDSDEGKARARFEPRGSGWETDA
ncbi:hypothetical protein AVEN_221271-1 [Araneus ventricosus]|uniref:Uncharacterized protein n=1 Tax=Araneus ventricosus TaxID=182803 RepID=A0A4Y2AYT4_ARAVE|nr:hypothetical protein AVEN_221271-1 [Araneus ventricosus]